MIHSARARATYRRRAGGARRTVARVAQRLCAQRGAWRGPPLDGGVGAKRIGLCVSFQGLGRTVRLSAARPWAVPVAPGSVPLWRRGGRGRPPFAHSAGAGCVTRDNEKMTAWRLNIYCLGDNICLYILSWRQYMFSQYPSSNMFSLRRTLRAPDASRAGARRV